MITAQPAIESTAIEKIAVCGDSCSLLRVSGTGVVTDLVTGAYRSLGIVRSLQALLHSAAGPIQGPTASEPVREAGSPGR